MDWHVFRCVQNKDGVFLVDCKLNNCAFELNLIQNSIAWTTEIHQEMLDNFARKLKMDPIDYLKRLKEHLNSENSEFKFTKNEFILQYTLSNNIKVKYLQCKLSKVQNNFDYMSNLLQNMYNEKNSARRELITLKGEIDTLKIGTSELQIKLTEFISKKKKDQEILISNFVLVLNEKKARIQHLAELLEAFMHGRPTVNPPPIIKEKAKNNKITKVEVKNEISESDSEDSKVDYNTDDEKCKDESNPPNHFDNDMDLEDNPSNYREDIPSTSKDYSSSVLFDELPPVHVLPKRMKYDSSKKEETCNLKIYEGATSSNKKSDSRVKKEEKTSSVSYNTQDLLDDI